MGKKYKVKSVFDGNCISRSATHLIFSKYQSAFKERSDFCGVVSQAKHAARKEIASFSSMVYSVFQYGDFPCVFNLQHPLCGLNLRRGHYLL